MCHAISPTDIVYVAYVEHDDGVECLGIFKTEPRAFARIKDYKISEPRDRYDHEYWTVKVHLDAEESHTVYG